MLKKRIMGIEVLEQGEEVNKLNSLTYELSNYFKKSFILGLDLQIQRRNRA